MTSDARSWGKRCGPLEGSLEGVCVGGGYRARVDLRVSEISAFRVDLAQLVPVPSFSFVSLGFVFLF
jgi:hypothetical protein